MSCEALAKRGRNRVQSRDLVDWLPPPADVVIPGPRSGTRDPCLAGRGTDWVQNRYLASFEAWVPDSAPRFGDVEVLGMNLPRRRK